VKLLLYILLALGYLLLPWDLVPDFFPLVGRVDDLVLVVYLIWSYLKFRRTAPIPNPQFEQAQDSSSRQESVSNEQPKQFDPYEILQLRSGATEKEIDRQYRKLAQKYHPDKVASLAEEFQELAHEKMIEIQKAYEMLSKNQ